MIRVSFIYNCSLFLISQQMLARKEESLAKYQEMLKEAREVR